MNKIVEEAMTNMIRRIEKLESDVSKLKNTHSPGTHIHKNGLATPGQKRYIVALGGVVPINMTMKEAGIEIDRLLKEKHIQETSTRFQEDVIESHQESPEVTEPEEVDTDEAGLEGDLM